MSKKNILTLSWAPRWRENPVYPDKQIHLLPSTKAASKNREYDYRFCFLRMMDECMLNCVRLFVTPWTVVCQASLSMEFSRQEYCSGLPFPTPEDLSGPGIELEFTASPALAGRACTTLPLGEPCGCSGRRLQVAKAPSLHCASLPPTPTPHPPHPYMKQGDCENEILAMGPEIRGTGFWGNSFRGHKESSK